MRRSTISCTLGRNLQKAVLASRITIAPISVMEVAPNTGHQFNTYLHTSHIAGASSYPACSRAALEASSHVTKQSSCTYFLEPAQLQGQDKLTPTLPSTWQIRQVCNSLEGTNPMDSAVANSKELEQTGARSGEVLRRTTVKSA
jgi:hypothetical protein